MSIGDIKLPTVSVPDLGALNRGNRHQLGDGLSIGRIDIMLEEVICTCDRGSVELRTRVPDRDTGEPIRITFHSKMPPDEDLRMMRQFEGARRGRAEFLRMAVRKMLCHEADEQIQLDGKRLFEPRH